MSNRITLHSNAVDELKNAVEWYTSKQNGLGGDFLDAVDQKLSQIALRPEAYSKKNSNFREAVLSRFPYVVIFHFHKLKKEVMVVAIHHTSRRPRKRFPKK
ncbi:MAG: type II toxin-antitoxin system RelE/ParE family toxin [Taibaiella sp.]|nr:type II toxin-antitoxin system RelE/ParE family toxin [Taibaiella sp.]